jgi:hypothetical protein
MPVLMTIGSQNRKLGLVGVLMGILAMRTPIR